MTLDLSYKMHFNMVKCKSSATRNVGNIYTVWGYMLLFSVPGKDLENTMNNESKYYIVANKVQFFLCVLTVQL